MSADRLLVIVPGFGDPHWDHKVDLFRSNLRNLRTHAGWTVQVLVAQYTADKELPPDLLGDPAIRVERGPGIVGEFIQHLAPPNTVCNAFDYVLLLLDDIELMDDIDWGRVLRWKRDLNLDIMSPSLTTDSKHIYDYMMREKETNIHMKIVPACEMFCYLMDVAAYARWWSFLDDQNPWLWGMDLILHRKMGLKVGLMQTYSMRHHYQNTCYDTTRRNAARDFGAYIARFGETQDSLSNQPNTLYWVHSRQ